MTWIKQFYLYWVHYLTMYTHVHHADKSHNFLWSVNEHFIDISLRLCGRTGGENTWLEFRLSTAFGLSMLWPEKQIFFHLVLPNSVNTHHFLWITVNWTTLHTLVHELIYFLHCIQWSLVKKPHNQPATCVRFLARLKECAITRRPCEEKSSIFSSRRPLAPFAFPIHVRALETTGLLRRRPHNCYHQLSVDNKL